MYISGEWTHRPDYLTLTGKWGNKRIPQVSEPADSADAFLVADIILGLFMDGRSYFDVELKTIGAPRHYRYAFSDSSAGVMIALGSARQGWMIQLTGAWWAVNLPNGATLQGWLDAGLNCTRFDYAATALVTDDLESVAEYFKDSAERAQRAYNKNEPVWHKPHAAPHLQTHYAGARTSAQFLRVYDKKVGDDTDFKYIRVEMEYKRGHAPRALLGYIEHGVGDIRGILEFMYAGAVDMLLPELAVLYDDTSPARIGPRIPPPPSDRAAWFYGNVEAAFQKWAADDNQAAGTWLDIMAQRYIEGRK